MLSANKLRSLGNCKSSPSPILLGVVAVFDYNLSGHAMIATIAAVEFVLWFTLWNVHLCHGSDVNGSYSEQKPGSASRSTAPQTDSVEPVSADKS